METTECVYILWSTRYAIAGRYHFDMGYGENRMLDISYNWSNNIKSILWPF